MSDRAPVPAFDIDVSFQRRAASSDETVVVIDALRFTSIVAIALDRGVRTIFPCQSVEECLATRQPGEILAAERMGQVLPGFDVGTSPATFWRGSFPGRSVRATGSDGAPTCHLAAGAKKVYLGAFVNLTALARRLLRDPGRLTFICAGSKGRDCVEDTCCAGALIERMQQEAAGDSSVTFVLSGDARTAVALWESRERRVRDILFTSEWGRGLVERGRTDDVETCTYVDAVSVIPVLRKDPLRIERETQEAG